MYIFQFVGEGFPLPHYNVGTDVLGCPIVVSGKKQAIEHKSDNFIV